jgi:hypothetical protein
LKRRDIRVKTGKFRSKQLFSDLPPKADLTADIVDVSQLIDPRAFAAYLKPLRDSKGWSTASATSGDRRRCCVIWRATEIDAALALLAAIGKAKCVTGDVTGGRRAEVWMVDGA